MNARPFFSRPGRSPIFRRAAVALVALAWSGLAFGGEIHDAARDGSLDKVKALLKGDPHLVSSKDKNGFTPLHWAAYMGQKEVAECLLAAKAEVNAKDNGGCTPLHRAASNGHKDVAEALLAAKAEVNAKDNGGCTPLHRAAANGRKEVAALLLANKADVNARDKNGETPLDRAVDAGQKEVAAVLLQALSAARDTRY